MVCSRSARSDSRQRSRGKRRGPPFGKEMLYLSQPLIEMVTSHAGGLFRSR